MEVQKIPEKPEPLDESLRDLIDLRISSAMAQVLDRVHLIDRQVADLQTDAVQAKKPWYRDASIIISVAALLFSLVTTVVSQRQVEEQRRQSYRAELRGLIQRISEIPRQNIEYRREFTDPTALANLDGLLQAENAMIARQAEEIMGRLPGEVAASEYSLIGLAMANSNLPDEAIRLFDKAIDGAKNANDKVAALRGKGALLIAAGDFARGRTVFEQALGIFEEYPTKNDFYKDLTHVDTHLFWAGAEYAQGQCEQVASHLQAARDHAAKLVPGPLTTQKLQQVEGAATFATACVPRASGSQDHRAALVPGVSLLVP